MIAFRVIVVSVLILSVAATVFASQETQLPTPLDDQAASQLDDSVDGGQGTSETELVSDEAPPGPVEPAESAAPGPATIPFPTPNTGGPLLPPTSAPGPAQPFPDAPIFPIVTSVAVPEAEPPTMTPTPALTARATSTTTPRASATPTVTRTATHMPFGGGGASIELATPIPFNPFSPGPSSGAWSGMTSQGKPMTFTVAGTSITSVSVGWTTEGCGSIDGQTAVTYSANPPQLEGNSFTLMGPPPAGGGLVIITGAFSSPTTAGGRVNVTIFGTPDPSGAGCGSSADVSWTAVH